MFDKKHLKTLHVFNYPKAQQSCVPATAPRAKVMKQLSVCPSVRQPVCLSVFSVQSEYIGIFLSQETICVLSSQHVRLFITRAYLRIMLQLLRLS